MQRRNFISNTTCANLAFSLLGVYACKNHTSQHGLKNNKNSTTAEFNALLKLSQAPWSLHKMILSKNLNPIKFAQKAKELGFDGQEYVNQLYNTEIKKRGNTNQAILDIMNAALLAEVMQRINMQHCGTVPDFGNFCNRRKGNELWSTPCVEELMPYAKGVSAKSFNFDKNGHETDIDFFKMMSIIKSAGYNGYIGVEYIRRGSIRRKRNISDQGTFA